MTQQLIGVATALEAHVAASGWDQPPRLYALVDTADLLAREPQLVDAGVDAAEGSLTPVEQEDLPDVALADLFAQLAWPAEVAGCAFVHELLVLPEQTEAGRPDGIDLARWAAEQPERRELRVAVAVLRNGSRGSCLRVRATAAGDSDELLTGEDLAPNLATALIATLD